jgi:hydroxyacylglutathione hydrolase
MSFEISSFVLGPIKNNTYLVADTATKKAAIIDPSAASQEILQNIQENNWNLEYILITHAHFDHIGGVKWLIKQFKRELNVALHPADLELWREGGGSKDFGIELSVGSDPNLLLEDNQIFRLGESSIKVLHTPGHTPGHVTFSAEKDMAAFCGDLIFYHGIGRTDLKMSNEDDLIKSIRGKIFMLDDRTTLFPGHGPATTVQEEKDNNPFL